MSPGRRRPRISDGIDQVSIATSNSLIRQYKIRFLKYSSNWPPEYRRVFGDIKKIGREEYEKHRSNGKVDDFTVAQTKERVTEVVNASNRVYEAGGNEQTLRIQVESLVFRRFESETICRRCRRHLWIFEHAPISMLPADGEELRSCHPDTMLCRCSLPERYEGRFVSGCTTGIFSKQCSTPVKHHPDDELPGYPIPHREPDTVIGLHISDTMRHYTQGLYNLDYTPFPNTGDLAYPFMISEAKNGNRNPGFKITDNQTAFPIRTCLMIQKRLQEDSILQLSPLVWYASYVGDIWKIAACVTQDDEVRVYTLWSGSAQDPDKALQLLRIIDYVAQWARTTFRDTVLACLAGGRDALQRLTPAHSVRAPSVFGLSQRSVQSRLPSPEPEGAPELVDSDMDDYVMGIDLETNFGRITPPMANTASSRSLSRLSGSNLIEEDDEIKHATFRNACHVMFQFSNVRLPDSPEDLTTFIRSTFDHHPSEEELKTKAYEVFQIFSSTHLTITINNRQINHLENKWLWKEAVVPCSFLDGDHPTSTWIQVNSEFDPASWHVVRRLTCISCSATALRSLSQLIGQTPTPTEDSMFDRAMGFNLARSAMISLRYLPGELSAQAALQNWSVHLQFDLSTRACHWDFAFQDLATILGPYISFNEVAQDSGSHNFLHKQTQHVEVLSIRAREVVSQLLGQHINNNDEAVLLKKPSHWPQATEDWCLMVLREHKPGEYATLGTKLAAAVDKEKFYMVQQDLNAFDLMRLRMNQSSQNFLKDWQDLLASNVAPSSLGDTWLLQNVSSTSLEERIRDNL